MQENLLDRDNQNQQKLEESNLILTLGILSVIFFSII